MSNPNGIPAQSPGLRACELSWVLGRGLGNNPKGVAARRPKGRTASRPRLAAATNTRGRSNVFQPSLANERAASRGRLAVRAAFTLMEVMIAATIFFIAIFSILALVSNTLRNARALRHIEVDAGMVAAQLFKTNRFTEGIESGDFGHAYPDYSWSTESVEATTNGLWQFNISVIRRGQHEPVDAMSLFIFSPESVTPGFGRPR